MYFVQLFYYHLGFLGILFTRLIYFFDCWFLHHSRRRGFSGILSLAYFIGSDSAGQGMDNSTQSKDIEGYGNGNTDCWTYTIHQKGHTHSLVGYIQQKAGKTLLTRLKWDIY